MDSREKYQVERLIAVYEARLAQKDREIESLEKTIRELQAHCINIERLINNGVGHADTD